MCTLTLISLQPRGGPESRASGPSFRLVMNRDELRTRAPGLPPSLHTIGARSILMPIDPVSQGTWIGINDCGIFVSLLNLTEPDQPSNPDKSSLSRGGIIPLILKHSTLDRAIDEARHILTANYSPFRLLIGAREGLYVLHSRARTLKSLAPPLLLTSSGLGDDLVQTPRAMLFVSTIARDPSASTQDAFHYHVFPGQHHLSVFMDRADARTVSTTTLEISSVSATMYYQDILTGEMSSSALTLAHPAETAIP